MKYRTKGRKAAKSRKGKYFGKQNQQAADVLVDATAISSYIFLYKVKEYINRIFFTETRHVMNTSKMISTDLLSHRVLSANQCSAIQNKTKQRNKECYKAVRTMAMQIYQSGYLDLRRKGFNNAETLRFSDIL